MFRVIISVLSLLLIPHKSFAADRLIVFAPASLSDVMNDIARQYERDHGRKIILSIAGTSQLARQLEAGAPAHIFISADRRWMDWAEQKNLINPQSNIEIASNRLVVAVRRETENWVDVEALLTQSSFAMGEPGSVPVGQYARQALTAKGWWQAAKSQAIFSENARVTLRRLALGEVGAAIVYATDVAVEPAVRTLITFPKDSHGRISYLAAMTKTKGQGSAEFMAYLASPAAGIVFTKAGFVSPKEEQ